MAYCVSVSDSANEECSNSSDYLNGATMANGQSSSNGPTQRVIALMDVDSFECQIFKRLFPQADFFGQAWIVADKTGRIVSATHEARDLGISRNIREWQARKIAKEKKVALKVFKKPNDREKPDTKEVRYATWDVLDSLVEFTKKHTYGVIIEYSSSDEFYLDLTEEVDLLIKDSKFETLIESRTFLETEDEKIGGESLKRIIGKRYRSHQMNEAREHEKRLLCGALIMQDMSNYVFAQTKLIVSVGVSTNKLLAKMAVNLNKPEGITILPETALPRVGMDIPIEKIPGFGGDFGTTVKEKLNVSTLTELSRFNLDDLEVTFTPEKATQIFTKSHGICDERVKHKLMPNEVCSRKTFYGQLTSPELLKYHLFQLIEEMLEKLEEELERHKRQPTTLRISLYYFPPGVEEIKENERSWTNPTTKYETRKTSNDICNEAMNAMLDDKFIDADDTIEVKVVKIEVRSKGFENIKNSDFNLALA